MDSKKSNDQPANTSTVVSTRETYIDHLDRLLQLHEPLRAKLSSLETTSNSADGIISGARQSLEKSITGTNIASTVGSGLSIVGGILTFTPLFFVGASLLVVGTATSAGSSIAKGFIFEKDAATAFEQAINKYTTSSNDLQSLLQQIEDAKEQLVASLTPFLAALQTELPSIPSGPGGTPSSPGFPKPGGSSPFSFNVFQGVINGGSATKPWLGAGTKTAGQLSDWLAKSGGTAGQVLGKTLPKLIKGLPVLSIAIDVMSIVTTWTGTNETLEKADKLRKEIKNSTDAYRQRVQEYLSALEELVGSPALQDTLRKLMRLRTAIPGRRPPGGGPPTDPDQPCKMLAQMEKMFDVPFLIFASLQGQDHDDSTQNDYATDLVPEADVVQLSQKTMTAAVVDSLFESYPAINTGPTTTLDDKDKGKDKPPQVGVTGIGLFRLQCSFVHFGGKEVYNVSGSSVDHRVRSWVRYWRWWVAQTRSRSCLAPDCFIKLSSTIGYVDQHNQDWIVGGHLEPENNTTDRNWYILPICQRHNAPSGTFDRGGKSMITFQNSWAVRIPQWP